MKRNKLLQSLAIALLGFATTMPVYAELTQNDAGYYEIASDENYEEFRQMVATGNPYANAVLTNNITVKDAIGKGDVQFHYRGTFDGQNYTITLDNLTNNTNNHPWGLFQYTEPGCVIRNLTVTGTAVNKYESLGSIVGQARGTRIENCISTVDLKAIIGTAPDFKPGGFAGGLIGAGYGVNFVENCAFVGSIYSSEAYGIVGYVEHNIEIKSCYVDATFSNPGASKQIILKNDDGQILLNNYYHKRGDTAPTDVSGATEVSDGELTNGKLCFNLNVKGRRGLVWYQYSDRPYPFNGTGGQVASKSSTSDAIIVYSSCVNHRYDHGLCSNCGGIESGKTVAPLQICSGDANNKRINNYRFKLNDNLNPKTAEFLGLCEETPHSEITAVHIPETIIVEGFIGLGEEYIVDYVKTGALKGSEMEYLYISKSVNHIDDNALNNCTSLKYLHFADRPDDDEKQRLLFEFDVEKNKGLFHDCPLETVYIGRQLNWRTYNPVPFYEHDTIKNVFWGPRVKRIGNYIVPKAPREGNADAFEGCTVNNIYFMGDEKTLHQDDVEVWMYKGLCEATNFYVNRTIKITDDIDDYTTYWENGIFKSCANVAFGPFVKYIAKDLFGGTSILGTEFNFNTKLQHVDFTNAFNLERIEDKAFEYCHEAKFGQFPFRNTKLVSIGEYAFTDCDGFTTLSIPATVETIGGQAFDDCDKLISVIFEDGTKPLKFTGDPAFNDCDLLESVYQGRDFSDMSESPFTECDILSTVMYGPQVTHLTNNSYAGLDKLSAFSFLESDEPLIIDNLSSAVGDSKLSMLFINRMLKDSHGIEQIDWGSQVKSTVRDINFGDKIDHIHEHQFQYFKALKSVSIPSNINDIRFKAFYGCTNLETVCIMGPARVMNEAFGNCSGLKYVYLMNKDIELRKEVFLDSSNISEVYTAFESDPEVQSAEDAFMPGVYSKAHLVCAGDMGVMHIELQTKPWSLFADRTNPLLPKDRNVDYVCGYMDEGEYAGEYEHAYVAHHAAKGFDMVYLPFDMDSYYFGADAEVYSLRMSDGGKYADNYTPGSYVNDYTHFLSFDIENNKTLTKGVYLINTPRRVESLQAHRNLYDGTLIEVDNSPKTIEGVAEVSKMQYGGDALALTASDNAFVFCDSVLQCVNGDYLTQANSVVLFGNAPEGCQMEFSMMDEKSRLLVSSKIDLPFSEYLEGYASFYDENYNYIAPEWCDVYVVTSTADETIKMEMVEDRVITKGQAVLLHSHNDASVGLAEYLTYATHGSSAVELYENNLLKGVSKDTPVSELSGADNFVYVLSCNASHQKTGFYKYSSPKVLPAGKAYLLPSVCSMAKACLFVCDEAAEGISHIESDGMQMIYNLMGRRLSEAGSKGIYIIDNKKVFK